MNATSLLRRVFAALLLGSILIGHPGRPLRGPRPEPPATAPAVESGADTPNLKGGN